MSLSAHRQQAAQLTLLGTVHRDPLGEERLTSLLATLRPDLVTLEMSPAALDYRQRHGRLLLQRLDFILERLARERGGAAAQLAAHPAVAGIRALLELPFEYRAVRHHAANGGCGCELLDLSEISLSKLRRVETELITYHNLKVLTSLAASDSTAGLENYATARAMLNATTLASTRLAFLARCRGPEGIGPRDQHMATILRQRCADRPGRQLLHIGGWVHLVDDPCRQTLYSLLADCAPQRLLLADAAGSTP